MPYKDKEKQRQAVKAAAKRYKDKQKGITQGITGKPYDVIPKDVNSMSAQEVQALLDSWYEGNGTPYQQRLAVLGRHYSSY